MICNCCKITFQNCGESVTSIHGGVVGTATYDELLVTTYTGIHF